jgi:hypothetical protein
MDPRQLAEHLRFYQEIGITGISRDPNWRQREDETSTPNVQLPTPKGAIRRNWVKTAATGWLARISPSFFEA